MLDKIIHKYLAAPYSLNVVWFAQPKKYRATIVFLHGIGSSSKMWQKVAEQLPKDVRSVAIDLLGYGDSPKPEFKPYDIRTQSLSLAATLPKLKITSPVILVGHSLGALVAIDFTKNYRVLVRSLIACSPPLYESAKSRITKEQGLLSAYLALINSKLARTILLKGKPYRIVNPGYSIDEDNVEIFFKTLSKSIIKQKSMKQLSKLRRPTKILYGKLDPVIVPKNIHKAAKDNVNIKIKSLPSSGHEIGLVYRQQLVAEITRQLDKIEN